MGATANQELAELRRAYVRYANELCNGTECGIYEFDGSLVPVHSGFDQLSGQLRIIHGPKRFHTAATRGVTNRWARAALPTQSTILATFEQIRQHSAAIGRNTASRASSSDKKCTGTAS